MNEKFKTENVKIKARKLVIAFLGSYCSENENILFRMVDIIPKMEYTICRREV